MPCASSMLCSPWGGALRVLRWVGWGWASVLLGAQRRDSLSPQCSPGFRLWVSQCPATSLGFSPGLVPWHLSPLSKLLLLLRLSSDGGCPGLWPRPTPPLGALAARAHCTPLGSWHCLVGGLYHPGKEPGCFHHIPGINSMCTRPCAGSVLEPSLSVNTGANCGSQR